MARVNPSDYLARRSGMTTLPPADMTTGTLGVVALEIAPLRGLGGAQCVLEAVGALAADVRAGHTASTLPRLRTWAARWKRVREDLRAFYEEQDVQASRAGGWAIRRILEGEGTAPGPLRGELDRMWIERHGAKAPFSLIPLVSLEQGDGRKP